MHTGEFGDIFKVLTISYLNFIDTDLIPKTGLKGPHRAGKRATVAAQLWPFHIPTVALLRVRRARTRMSASFFSGLKPTFHSGWRVPAEVILLILFFMPELLQN
ncbi:hypothetical protein HMPREF6485_1861 [Segatella buccae ATCC 33574]|uniref:Uncharacterized protein n=1 Tax=Segatella buccae ATCC 33574 TaxID=873513 RepID=E6K7L5_9BACT|nr:hypothetical protein HMPREF6485_1861 [Segatella buccae ATCC 33574]